MSFLCEFVFIFFFLDLRSPNRRSTEASGGAEHDDVDVQ